MLHTFMLSLFQIKVTGAHMKDFGMRLQELRKQRGMTQKMLAERINKSLSAVSSYETNAQMPPLDVLISIASVLNVSLDCLAGLERKEAIIIDGFSDSQKDLLNMLVQEFSKPSVCVHAISDEQTKIINKLLCIFFEKT